jgi:hypothetical protein
MDVGSTYVEVYQEDLLTAKYARFTEAIDKEIKARIRKSGKAFVAIDKAPPKPTERQP